MSSGVSVSDQVSSPGLVVRVFVWRRRRHAGHPHLEAPAAAAAALCGAQRQLPGGCATRPSPGVARTAALPAVHAPRCWCHVAAHLGSRGLAATLPAARPRSQALGYAVDDQEQCGTPGLRLQVPRRCDSGREGQPAARQSGKSRCGADTASDWPAATPLSRLAHARAALQCPQPVLQAFSAFAFAAAPPSPPVPPAARGRQGRPAAGGRRAAGGARGVGLRARLRREGRARGMGA